jgi:lysophospholipase L1-like esterase
LISDHDLKPDLVSAIIGSNDIMWRRGPQRIASDAKSLMESLPKGTYLSRVSQSNREGRRSAIAAVFETMAFARDIELFGAWNWPTAEGMWAQDKFHPNDDAYKYIADNLWASLHSTNFF